MKKSSPISIYNSLREKFFFHHCSAMQVGNNREATINLNRTRARVAPKMRPIFARFVSISIYAISLYKEEGSNNQSCMPDNNLRWIEILC
jgi:hypothetical protein